MFIVCVGLSIVSSLMLGSLGTVSPISITLFLLSPNIERLLVLEVCFFGLGLLVTRSCNIAVTEVQIGTEDLENEDGYKYDIITAVLPAGVAHVEEEKAGEEQEK